MSSVRFMTRSGRTARLSGAEYVHMNMLCANMLKAMLPPFHTSITRHIVAGHYLLGYPSHGERGLGSPWWQRGLDAAIGTGMGNLFVYKGEPVKTFDLSVNTALVFGSETVALLAKLAGLAAGHLAIEPEHHSWFGDLVEQGLRQGLYRRQMGWEDVLDNLGGELIVTDFSGSDDFPRRDWQSPKDGWGEEDLECEWANLEWEERWDRSEKFLREERSFNLLTPENLRATFSHDLTILDVINQEA